jgi:hypothetical protein
MTWRTKISCEFERRSVPARHTPNGHSADLVHLSFRFRTPFAEVGTHLIDLKFTHIPNREDTTKVGPSQRHYIAISTPHC